MEENKIDKVVNEVKSSKYMNKFFKFILAIMVASIVGTIVAVLFSVLTEKSFSKEVYTLVGWSTGFLAFFLFLAKK